jgi:hypothetical protein
LTSGLESSKKSKIPKGSVEFDKDINVDINIGIGINKGNWYLVTLLS